MAAGGLPEFRDVPDRPNPQGARRRPADRPSPALAAAALSAGPNPLTNRERDVLAAADGGATIADIARRLFLSESTARNYLSSAIGKTGTRNRIEAVQTARHHGWLLPLLLGRRQLPLSSRTPRGFVAHEAP
jgi:DNA-binding NarL/FixJ family response regulator